LTDERQSSRSKGAQPGGLRRKWAGGCVAPQSRIDLDMLLRRALPTAHFDRNATTPVTDLVH
jgi:hypothetical protein